jgi:hypothetical protein
MTDYHWREEWQKAFCIAERRRMVDMKKGWFAVVAVHRMKGRYCRRAVFFGRSETARDVYFALMEVVDMGVLDGCYVFADASSVEDKAPCLMDSYVREGD